MTSGTKLLGNETVTNRYEMTKTVFKKLVKVGSK